MRLLCCYSSQYLALANKDQNQSGRTRLDRERLKLCMAEVVRCRDTTLYLRSGHVGGSDPLPSAVCLGLLICLNCLGFIFALSKCLHPDVGLVLYSVVAFNCFKATITLR